MTVHELTLLEYADMMRNNDCVCLGDMGGFRYFVVRWPPGNEDIYKVALP